MRVFHAGNNLSAISLAFSRKTLSPERSYALRSPPTTLKYQKRNKSAKEHYLSFPQAIIKKRKQQLPLTLVSQNKINHELNLITQPYGCLENTSII